MFARTNQLLQDEIEMSACQQIRSNNLGADAGKKRGARIATEAGFSEPNTGAGTRNNSLPSRRAIREKAALPAR